MPISIVGSGDCYWLLVCSGVLVCSGISTNRSIQIPESTIYRKALLITKKHKEKYMQGDVFIARDYYIVHTG